LLNEKLETVSYREALIMHFFRVSVVDVVIDNLRRSNYALN